MQEVLAIALASMHHDMSRVDHIALNLANATTPGYKREVVAVRPFADAVDALAAEAQPGGEVARGEARPSPGALQVFSDLRPGTLKMTGQPLDLALMGDGFFEVSTASGPAYTRQGTFKVDERGRLVTLQGHSVMGRSGEITLTTQNPLIDAAGNVTEPHATTGPSAGGPGAIVAQLKVVRFDRPEALERLGEGLLTAPSGLSPSPLADTRPQVRQGALENANVSSMHEMVQLVQTMRHFESMQKVAQGCDEMLGTAIRKLGDL
jgi:flagellar basal-body rod protein FlgG